MTQWWVVIGGYLIAAVFLTYYLVHLHRGRSQR